MASYLKSRIVSYLFILLGVDRIRNLRGVNGKSELLLSLRGLYHRFYDWGMLHD